MGLDMYLNKKIYVGPNYRMSKDLNFETKILLNGVNYSKFNPEKVTYVTEEVAYWRKFYALHDWFVKNVQNGEDDCEQYAVYLEDFVKLQLCLSLVLDAQNTCLAGRLSEEERDVICLDNFPPTEGFFSGSREIDDSYWEDVVSTKRIVESIIIQMNQSIIDKDSVLINYYYRSSW